MFKLASPPNQKNLAMTLLEVVIAGVLLSTMVFLVWLFLPRALMLEKQLELRDYAQTLAKNQLAALKTKPEPASIQTTGPYETPFQVSTQLSEIQPGLSEGTVQVLWTYRERQQNLVVKTRWAGVGFL